MATASTSWPVRLASAQWSIGSACFDGFTTALTPNYRMMVGTAPQLDIDYDTNDENNGGPTYAAITSRSHHPGGVNTLSGDGSVARELPGTWVAPAPDRKPPDGS